MKKKIENNVLIRVPSKEFREGYDWEPVEYNGLWLEFAAARRRQKDGIKLLKEFRVAMG